MLNKWEASVQVREATQLTAFFGTLTLKEHIAPNIPVRPLVAELFLTENCNLRCVSCACWTSRTRDELGSDEWRDVLRQLVDLHIYKVNFTGGEPLIRRDAIELIAFARDLGIRRIHLNTNGILLTPRKLEAVLDAGVRSFNVSVDGPSALVHDQIRGRLGAFEKTMQHLEGLLAERERLSLRIRMNFTVMRDNVQFLPDMARLAQKLRVQLYLNLATDRTFLFRHQAVSEQTQLDEESLHKALLELEEICRKDPSWLPRFSDLAYIPKHFSEIVQRDLPCAESQLKLMIHSRGEVGGCWGEPAPFNVRNESLAEILGSTDYRADQARLFRKDCVGCGSNYSLNLRWRPHAYVADAMWRAGLRRLVAK
jgi:MoaA/NifB/PqqE/SkfB family radical SAM enzyme